MKTLATSVFVCAALVPALASANGDVPEQDPLIFNGTETDLCAWPTTVAVSGNGSLCTGTLIHPQIVIYAAHCGAQGKSVKFGESTISGKTVQPEMCMTNPAYSSQGNDWAFCKIPAVTDIPFTPSPYGCEESILQVGASIAIAGFGNTNGDVGSGTKRWAMTTLTSVNFGSGTLTLGGGGQPSVCSGDSGGPAFMQYPDGSWHAFGIASTVTGGCGGYGTHALIPNALDWVAQQSGVDPTPCHDADGEWNPGPLCGNFYSGEAGVGYGSWSGSPWCEGTPALEWSETCGASFPSGDNAPPVVAITSPADGTVYDDDPATFSIEIDASDDSGYLKGVGLEINGMLQNIVDDDEPWAFNDVQFPAGQYVIVAVAEDYAGNIVKSEPVGVGVGMDAPDPNEEGDGDGEGTDGDGEDGTGSGSSGSGTGTTGADDGGKDGCGCSASADGSSGGVSALLGLGLLGLWRRRRS